MRPGIALLWRRVHASYWFYPTLLLLAGGAAALGLTALDERLDGDLAGSISGIYAGGADGARAMLSAIATSVLGVAGTTFSITVAILSLTSSQFGPRLLRNFMRDTGNQVVLGTFIATFLYCLLVLRTVRSVNETPFVPHLSVTVGVALGVICVGMLVYFIHHIVRNIQASHFIAAAGADLLAAVERLYPEQIGEAAPAVAAPFLRAVRPVPIAALRSGYVQAFDGDALIALAREAGGTLELMRAPGAFVAAGTPLARLHGGEADIDETRRRLDVATTIGAEATEVQDVTMPLNQLTEIAMRALSPSLNDPNTALMCVDRLCAALCVLIGRRFPERGRADPDGAPRVLATAPDFEELVHLAFDPVRRYGRHDLRVLVRLLDSLEDIAGCGCDAGRRAALARLSDEILRAGRDGLASEEDRHALEERQRAVREAIGGAGHAKASPRPARGGG